MTQSQARAFAPASVGNIGVGFDLLGHSIIGPRDIATVRLIEAPEVRIVAICGEVAGVEGIPLEAARNTAGRALQALREGLSLAQGFELGGRHALLSGNRLKQLFLDAQHRAQAMIVRPYLAHAGPCVP